MKNKRMVINIILIALAILIAIIPFVINNGTKLTGTDDKAVNAILNINSDYKPWFKPIWEPPNGEMQSLLFSLQASIGAGIIGYYIGRTSKKKEK